MFGVRLWPGLGAGVYKGNDGGSDEEAELVLWDSTSSSAAAGVDRDARLNSKARKGEVVSSRVEPRVKHEGGATERDIEPTTRWDRDTGALEGLRSALEAPAPYIERATWRTVCIGAASARRCALKREKEFRRRVTRFD